MSSDFSASVDRGKRPVKVFGSGLRAVQIPNLMELQINAYSQFLQRDVHWADRDNIGLESILREIFPIESYDGSINLTYLGYDLGSPRYTVDECRQLKLTYGAPFKIRLQLVKEGGETLEEEVYLGEIPLMIGGGEFIVNGSERVIVSQLHRSPGVDFSAEIHTGEVKLHSCRIIPERGSWVEFNVTKKGALSVRIDQSGKFPASMLLRAMEEEFGTSTALL
ncbi:MAG: DNA-directed RNA polymerase subunit beta, partial [Planctomycetia bacterium]|nr:DNA-directed RNA polymerase subunit beta [Planctomycetia bacterium]